jgi:hypothetical protein
MDALCKGWRRGPDLDSRLPHEVGRPRHKAPAGELSVGALVTRAITSLRNLSPVSSIETRRLGKLLVLLLPDLSIVELSWICSVYYR